MPIGTQRAKARRILKGSPFYGDETKLFCSHGHAGIWFYDTLGRGSSTICPLCKALADVKASDERAFGFLARIEMLEGTVARQSETIDKLVS